MRVDRRVLAASVFVLVWAAGCAGARYEACPVRLEHGLPQDAFVRCRDELLYRFGGLVVVDADAFLLQTGWVPVADPVGEQRASVFKTDDGRDLEVLVEFRWLATPWFGVPKWTTGRGDQAAERELAVALREKLTGAH